MGYYVSYKIEAKLDMSREAEAVAAINALHEPSAVETHGNGGSWSGGVRTRACYSCTDNPPEGGFKTLKDALSAWRFELSELRGYEGEFTFTGEKLGQEERLFDALAPFLEGDIYASGEDDEWGYRFKDGKSITLSCMREWVES
jgi:hypothetical protein